MGLPGDAEFLRLAEAAFDHLVTGNLDWDGFDPLLRRSFNASELHVPSMAAMFEALGRDAGPFGTMVLMEQKRFSDLCGGIFWLRSSKERRLDLLVAVNAGSQITAMAPVAVLPSNMPQFGNLSPIEREWTFGASFATFGTIALLWPGLQAGIEIAQTRTDTSADASLQVPGERWKELTGNEQSVLFDHLALLARDQYRLQSRPRDFKPKLQFALVEGETTVEGHSVGFKMGAIADFNVLAQRMIDTT